MRKLLSLSLKKISVLFGGRPGLIAVTLAALMLMFAAVSSVYTAKKRGKVAVACVDECGGELSAALISAISEAPGLDIIESSDRARAEDEMLAGSVEGILIVSADYDEKMPSGGEGLIDIITVPGSVSAELIRETAAGRLIAQRSRVQVLNKLTEEGFGVADFDAYAEEFDAPTLYRTVSLDGSAADTAVFGKGFPGYEGFAALALMLLLMTLTRRLSIEESRLVSARMPVIKHGRALDFFTDLTALLMPALLFSAAAFAFAPVKSLAFAAGLICYSLLLSSLCLLIKSLVGSGRVDMLSPAIALVTSILGGCFMDAGSLSAAMQTIAKFTPQGQLIAAVNGALPFFFVMLAEAVLIALAAFLKNCLQSAKR